MVLGGKKWNERLHVCDLSERALLFRCMVRGSIGIFTTSLGFAKCFFKPPSILQVIFIAWRSSCSQREKRKTFLQPISKFGNHFTTILKFGKSFHNQKAIFTAKGSFAAHGENRNIFAAIFKLGDHFTAIWKFGNHLAIKWEFRSPFLKLRAFS